METPPTKKKYYVGDIDNRPLKEIINYYDFYATRDGEECLPKTYYYTKYAAIAGAVFSVYEMVLVTQPKTVYSTMARFGHFTLPFAGMGFVFGSSLCLIAHARKKDDIYNHIMAGALAGSVWGFKYNRVFPGHLGALVFGFLAGYHKFFHVNDLPIYRIRTRDTIKYDPQLDFSIKIYDDPGRPLRTQ